MPDVTFASSATRTLRREVNFAPDEAPIFTIPAIEYRYTAPKPALQVRIDRIEQILTWTREEEGEERVSLTRSAEGYRVKKDGEVGRVRWTLRRWERERFAEGQTLAPYLATEDALLEMLNETQPIVARPA